MLPHMNRILGSVQSEVEPMVAGRQSPDRDRSAKTATVNVNLTTARTFDKGDFMWAEIRPSSNRHQAIQCRERVALLFAHHG